MPHSRAVTPSNTPGTHLHDIISILDLAAEAAKGCGVVGVELALSGALKLSRMVEVCPSAPHRSAAVA